MRPIAAAADGWPQLGQGVAAGRRPSLGSTDWGAQRPGASRSAAAAGDAEFVSGGAGGRGGAARCAPGSARRRRWSCSPMHPSRRVAASARPTAATRGRSWSGCRAVGVSGHVSPVDVHRRHHRRPDGYGFPADDGPHGGVLDVVEPARSRPLGARQEPDEGGRRCRAGRRSARSGSARRRCGRSCSPWWPARRRGPGKDPTPRSAP